MRVLTLVCGLLIHQGGAHAQNILVVLADDVGVDKVAAYGEHPVPARTPNLDALAARGILFRNAWAMPFCSPARAGLLTGRYGFRTGIGTIVRPTTPHALCESEVLIPEVLGPAWSSAAIGKWHLGNSTQGPLHPLLSGFPIFSGARYNLGATGGDYFHWEKQINHVSLFADTYATTDNVDDAIRAVQGLAEPWFIYLAFNAAHEPLHEPPASLHSYGALPTPTRGNEPVYVEAMIEAMDSEIGRLLGVVDEETTTVFFFGDNGTWRAATRPPWNPDHAKGTLFEGGVRVPFIAAGEAVQVSAECAALVSIVDLHASIAELAGRSTSAEDSVSFVPYLQDPSQPSIRPFLYAEHFVPNGPGPHLVKRRAARDLRYKLHLDEIADEERLYDLQLDPLETSNLLNTGMTAEQQVRYERLKRSIAELLAS